MIDAQQIVIVAEATPEYRWWLAGVVVPVALVVLGWALNRRRKP